MNADCWPSPAQGQLLRAALLPAPMAAEAWRAWELSPEARSPGPAVERLLPMAYANLRSLGLEDARLSALKGRYRAAALDGGRKLHLAATIAQTLGERGIPTVVLKGVAMTARYYRDPALRPMGDVDLLVRPAQWRAALDALSRNGWEVHLPGPPELAHAMLLSRRGRDSVDLHHHVFEECLAAAADDELWAAAVPIRLGGQESLALSHEDQFLHVCVHGLKWNSLPPLRWIADAFRVLAVAGDAFDWSLLARRARGRRLGLPLAAGLRLQRDLLGVVVPESALAELDGEAPWMERTAFRARTMAPELRGPVKTVGLHAMSYVRLRSADVLPAGAEGWRAFVRHTWGLTSLRALPWSLAQRALRRTWQMRRGMAVKR